MSATMDEQDDSVLRSSFNRFDSNGDKFVTMDEILATLTSNEDSLHRIGKVQGFQDEIRNFVSQNDTDGNRKLDEEEFIKAMKRFVVRDSNPETDVDEQMQVEVALNKMGSFSGSV